MTTKIKKNKLNIIENINGSVMHGLKKSDSSFNGFGEVYFSNIKYESIKAWKRHSRMTMNLLVPVGKVKFVFYDEDSDKKSTFEIGKDNYCRITVLPKIWFGFEGLHYPSSLILNISDIEHSPNEIERKEIDSSNFYWSKL